MTAPVSPSISVVIPAYNRETLITPTLDSVQAQILRPLEVLIVDDRSTDRTVAVIQDYARQHPGLNVKCLPQEKNQGVSAARNRGVREAQGDWIAFLDSDDMWEPNHLQALADGQAQSGAEVVFACAKGFSDTDPSVSSRTWGWRFQSTDEILRYLIKGCHILPSALMMRRQVFLDSGLFDEEPAIQHAEDLDLWLRLAANGTRFHLVRELTCLYRQHSASACQNKTRLYKAGVHCLKKHRVSPIHSVSDWNEAFAYYQSKLGRALWPADGEGSEHALWQAVRHQPASVSYWGALLLTAVSRRLHLGQEFVTRYERRYL
jgi:glycosyltransferase involved in cell wall biosynthesis